MVIARAPETLVGPRALLGVAAVALLLAAPLGLNFYYLIVLSYALVLAIACLGVNLLLGYTGLLSLGHAAYFGAGAYTGGFLYTFLDVTSLEPFVLSGVLSAVALATVFGFLCVRGTRIHFTILTLAFAQVVHAAFISGAVFRPFGGQGRGLFLLGYGGLYIPLLTIAGVEFEGLAFTTAYYYVILVAFFACLLVMWRLVNSPFGKALQAIRENETRAACIGIRVRTYRWVAFVISGGFTGLAGGMFGPLDRQVTPEQLHWLWSAKLILATVLGGHRYFLGPVLGAFGFTAIREVALRFALSHQLIMGLALIAVVLAFPDGLAGGAAVVLEGMRKFARQRRDP